MALNQTEIIWVMICQVVQAQICNGLILGIEFADSISDASEN